LPPFGAESFVFQFAIQKYIKIKIYRTINLLVLCGCETWSITLGEERRMRVFDNRVLRRTFGPKRDEVTGESRKLHKELNDLYSSDDQIERMRWVGHVACVRGEEKCTQGIDR
jgi:hypothetical protein